MDRVGKEAGREGSYQERLAPPPHFWRVYKVFTGFSNMQRDGVILVSFVNKFGVGWGWVGWGGVGGHLHKCCWSTVFGSDLYIRCFLRILGRYAKAVRDDLVTQEMISKEIREGDFLHCTTCLSLITQFLIKHN